MKTIPLPQRNLLTQISTKDSSVLKTQGEELKGDFDFMMCAIFIDAHSLYYASDELKDSEELVYIAVSLDPFCMMLASKALRNNIDFNLRCMKETTFSSRYATSSIKAAITRTRNRTGIFNEIECLQFLVDEKESLKEKKALQDLLQGSCEKKQVRRL